MTDRSSALIDVGLAFLDAHKPARFVAATTGGSVARREADEYSDLDLNIYVDDTEEHRSENRQFAGEIIQLHIQPFPRVEAVRQSPWDYRFLREAGVICDPAGRYESFAREAQPWLRSADGVSAACDLALADVEKRRSWAEEAILRRDHMEMGMASMAAMTDAAMLYRFCRHSAVSTGSPVTSVCESSRLPEVDIPWNHVRLAEARELVAGLAAYRRLLAEATGGVEDFVLDEVQDRMTAGKVARLVRLEDEPRLGEMLYHETFWVLLTRGSRPLAQHLSGLPDSISAVLRRIGYDEPEPVVAYRRLSWADDLCAAACS